MPRTTSPLAIAALVLTTSLLGGVAFAQTPASGEPPAAPVPPETYTLQILAVDAASVGLVFAGGVIDDNLGEGISTVGLGGLTLGGPIVHAAHGHWGRSAVSLGMRVVLPLVGAVIGAKSADCHNDQFLCGLSEMGLGLMIGEAVAITIDAGVLARWSAFQGPSAAHAQRGPDDRAEPPPRTKHAAFTFAPRVVATPERALVGVGGTFF